MTDRNALIDRLVRCYEAMSRSDRVYYTRSLAVDWGRSPTFRSHLNSMRDDALAQLLGTIQSNGDLVP